MATRSKRLSQQTVKAGLNTLLIAYVGFVILGLPDGLLGVAWPSIQESFGLSEEMFGVLLLPGTIAYMIISASSGRLITGWGIGLFLLLGTVLRALGLLGWGLAGGFALLLVMVFLNGLGSGAVDSGYNTYIASNYSAGRLSWLHACFGLGATMGPWIMSTVLANGLHWQTGYVIVAAMQALMIAAVFAVYSHWQLPDVEDAESHVVQAASSAETLRIPAVWLAILAFVLYTGLEVTAGNWAYSLYTESRMIDPAVAARWTSIYWGSLTIGRVVTGMVVDRLGAQRVLRLSFAGVVLGAVMFAMQQQTMSFLGLALIGFAQAAIFPTLIAITPLRFGAAHGPNAIGFQIGAAGLGVALVPGLAGVLAGQISLEIVGPYILVIAFLLWATFEMGVRLAPVNPAA